MNIIYWCLSWVLYYVGHVVSKVIFHPLFGWAYYVYNWLMCQSVDFQDKQNYGGPWQEKQTKKGMRDEE